MSVTWDALPHTPRGGTCTSASRLRQMMLMARGSQSGNCSVSSAFSWGWVRGASSSSGRATSSRASASTSAICRLSSPWVRSSRSNTSCVSGRSARASSPVTRWIVERMQTMRTTSRASIARPSSSGSNPARRDHSAV